MFRSCLSRWRLISEDGATATRRGRQNDAAALWRRRLCNGRATEAQRSSNRLTLRKEISGLADKSRQEKTQNDTKLHILYAQCACLKGRLFLKVPFLIQNISFVIVLRLCGGGRKELAETLMCSTCLPCVAFRAVARALGAVRLV